MPETTVRMNPQFVNERGLVPHSLRIESCGTPRWSAWAAWAGMQAAGFHRPQNQDTQPPRVNPGSAAVRPNVFSFGPCLRPFSSVVPSAWKALPSLLHISSRVTSSESFCQTNQLTQHSFPFPALFIFSEVDSVFLLCNYLFVLFFSCNVSSMRTDLVKLSVVPPSPELGHVERGQSEVRFLEWMGAP